MRVRGEDGSREFDLDGPPLGRGGEAAVYAVPGAPRLAAKVYHDPTPDRAGKLAAMLAAPPVDATGASGPVAVAWPVARLVEAEGSGRVVGYLMPRVEAARPVFDFYNPRARRQTCPLFHHGHLLRTARNLAAAVRRLHERGYVVGDVNESNVLVTAGGVVTLVDADSFQVPGPGGLYRCPVGRPEYTPPELQGASFADVDRYPEHDAFGLAVLIFQLLMQGLHPFAGLFTGQGEPDSIAARIAGGFWPYAWEPRGAVRVHPQAPPWWALPPAVQELFWRCFEEGHGRPDRRPSAAEWEQALEGSERELATCPANGQHLHHRGLDSCPWCELARRHGRDPFPARAAPPAAPPPPRRSPPAPVLVCDDPFPPRPAEVASLPARERRWLGWVVVAVVGGLVGATAQMWRPSLAPQASGKAPAAKAAPGPGIDAGYRQALQEYEQAVKDHEGIVKAHLRGEVSAQAVLQSERALHARFRALEKKRRAAEGRILGRD